MLPSGPGHEAGNTQQVLVSLIYAARRRVVLTTPYFVPDATFLTAMRTAAARGVDVNLVVSRHSNKPVVQFAQQSYYEDLLAAGVRIYLYRGAFLHAKHTSVDDSVAVIGSSNLDIRSFALNSEVSVLVYDPQVVADLRKIQDRHIGDSDEVTLQRWRTAQPGAALAAEHVPPDGYVDLGGSRQSAELAPERCLILQAAQIQPEQPLGDASDAPGSADRASAVPGFFSAVPAPRPLTAGATTSAALGRRSIGSEPLPI